MSRALLLVDVIKDFRHEDGDRLLASYGERHGALTGEIAQARAAGVPIVYANDNDGAWTSDAPGLVERAVEQGKAGPLVVAAAPQPGDTIVLKPR